MAKLNFVCEIGTEEIPAGYLPPAIEQVEKIVTDGLKAYRIGFFQCKVFATPRRIAILVYDMALHQSEDFEELKGPSVKAAYDDKGNPTRALTGFLEGNKITLQDTYIQKTNKGDYIYAKRKVEAKPTTAIIPKLIEQIILEVSFPKRMRWNVKRVSFPRPINYIFVLFNDTVVHYSIDGIEFDNKVRGHYIQHNTMIPLSRCQDYIPLLEKNGVIVDHTIRKDLIHQNLQKAASQLNGVLVEDEELLNTVTFLTEYPYVVTCSFDESFLAIPDIVLITEMKEHQKYFAVRDSNGNLLPKFLVVSNNPPTEHIVKGNQRVIRARFTDARFFFEEDRKIPLAGRVDMLKGILFHKELGSIYDKVERMQTIAKAICNELSIDESTTAKIQRAVMLSKTDLTTALVFEFTSLQGQIGKIYALLDGEDTQVAEAIDFQYRPRFQGDALPEHIVSIVVSLAEKIDNIFGSFSVGNIPKGSADPYALRRQAAAIVDMLVERKIHLDLAKICTAIAGQYSNGHNLIEQILEFINARAKTFLYEKQFAFDEVNACLAVGCYDYYELYLRAQSIHEFRKDSRFGDLLIAFKRMNNIVNAFIKKNPGYTFTFNPDALVADEEKNLYRFFHERETTIKDYIAKNKYKELFLLLIEGKEAIDTYFEKVMVMDSNMAIRDNRLGMLHHILTMFTTLLDFSQIQE
ncbi:MAG: glycine--tRNA ligase subunit beta [Spirochaetes bacterium]|nr:glycine--tRNA ligase subunit beta [Spirochaetota bacterium]